MSTHNEAVEDIKKAKSVLDAQPAPISKKFFTHTSVSMIKSGFRIAAGLALAGGGWLAIAPGMPPAACAAPLMDLFPTSLRNARSFSG